MRVRVDVRVRIREQAVEVEAEADGASDARAPAGAVGMRIGWVFARELRWAVLCSSVGSQGASLIDCRGEKGKEAC